MPPFEKIAADLGVEAPQLESESTPQDGVGDRTPSAMEDRVANIFEQNSETQPEGESDTEAQETQGEQPTGEDKPAEGDKPVEFEEASKQAFLTAEGTLDSDKLNGQFLEKGKSFIQMMSQPAQMPKDATTPKTGEVADPHQKFNESVTGVSSNLTSLIAQDKEQGFTPEQTLQRLQNTLSGFVQERDSALAIATEREGLHSEYRNELEGVRMQRIEADASKNFSELADGLDNLIPGQSATDTLNKFILSPQYGGRLVDAFFKRDNPDFANVPEADRKAMTDKWLTKFQANKQEFAVAASFGRAMWLQEQLPTILQHAQQMGAQKRTVESEAVGGGRSEVGRQQPAMSSKLSGFFGYDTVN